LGALGRIDPFLQGAAPSRFAATANIGRLRQLLAYFLAIVSAQRRAAMGLAKGADTVAPLFITKTTMATVFPKKAVVEVPSIGT
jgi:hypothetical protein